MPRKESTTGHISAQAQQDLVSDGIENYELPKSIITKIAKSAIPENAKLQKETVLSLVKGSTVFINYLAATAHDVAVSKQHKSISASDVLKALEIIEFGDMNDTLSAELQIYRNNLKAEKTRKERAEKLLAKGKAKESVALTIPPISIDPSLASASVKGKGKAQPITQTLAPPAGDMEADDIDAQMEVEDDVVEDTEISLDPHGDQAASDDDEGTEGDEPLDEDTTDLMAVEQEDLRWDAKGLEETNLGAGAEADD